MTTSTLQPQTPRPRRQWRDLVRAAAALAIVAALFISVGEDVGGSLLGPLAGLPRLAPSPVVAAPNSAQDDAIQQVIQHANDEQVQAIAARDPSAMADTSTPDHYQQLQQINQDLLDHGVTSIALVGLDWGPLTVTGSTATATTYETWSTTYADGSTEQSRDQNDYTLVQQPDGSWRIQSDDHPQASPSAGQPGSDPSAVAPPAPGASSGGDTAHVSHNWAGYAATGGGYTAVSGTWTVPDFSASSPEGVDATWVGIGGVTSRDLIQAGTQEETSGSGQTQYEAWIETLPQASRPVQLAVHPGDSVSVSIAEQSDQTWLISFANNTTGQSVQETRQYASSSSSAEWVEEAPSAGRGGILPLDNFGTLSFSGGSAVKNGQTESIADTGAQPISLIGAAQQPLAVPSALGPDGSSFSVTRTANAATPPAPTRRRLGNGG